MKQVYTKSLEEGPSGVFTYGRLNISLFIQYDGFMSSLKESWRQPQRVPPNHPGASEGSAS